MDTTSISPQQFSSQLDNSIELNTMIYNVSSSNYTKRVSNFSDTDDVSETYLERTLDFLIIGIIDIISNLFVILVLGSSVTLRQKLVNTLIIHQSFVDLLVSISLVGTAHLNSSDQHGLNGIHAEVYCFLLAFKWPLWVMMVVSSFRLFFSI